MSSPSESSDALEELERFLQAIQKTRALRSGVHHPAVAAPVSAPPPPGKRRWPYAAYAAAALTVLLLAGLWATRPAPPVSSSVAGPPAAATSAPEPITGPPSSSPARPLAPLRVEIVGTRPVWVRIVADGQPGFEGEIPAGVPRRFDALRMIVVRIGDAGAVRLLVNDADQGVLGRDGRVVTRTFSRPD